MPIRTMRDRSGARAARRTTSSSSRCWKKQKPRLEIDWTVSMNHKKANPAAVSTFADHEVIVPPNRLKKAVEKVKPGVKVDFDPVARAEAALAELADDFSVWMDQECGRLDAARNTIDGSGLTRG